MTKVDKIKVSTSQLEGIVKVSGAKNSVLRLMAASLLTDEVVSISNYPSTLLDAIVHQEMLGVLGKRCDVEGQNIRIEEGKLASRLEWAGRSIRNTLLILGALTARTGEGAVPLPGGCNIGEKGTERAYDLHVMLLQKLGASVWEEDGYLCARAPSDGLVGADIQLPIRSTGATENAILAGCLARGTTRIWNPHVRPEILDLIAMLNAMGAKVSVHGQEHIRIDGVEHLHGVQHKVVPDNVEALTWLVGAAVTGGEVEIIDFPYKHLEVPLIFLRESGAGLFPGENSLIVKGSKCFPMEISTGPYPGINSDMQPLLAVYGARAHGRSKFVDLRFPGRYGFAEELKLRGLNATIRDNLLIIDGGAPLKGAEVKALDLRAGVSEVLAGLFAQGETTVSDAWQITRGYDRFVEKMTSLGANISIVEG